MPSSPRASASQVRDELDIGESAYSSQTVGRWLTRAHHIVEERLVQPGTTLDDSMLTEIEVLVAAHFGHPHVTGSAGGTRISSINSMSKSISFETGPDGNESPYWHQAVMLAPRLDNEPTDTGGANVRSDLL